jgi:hypothetical protein
MIARAEEWRVPAVDNSIGRQFQRNLDNVRQGWTNQAASQGAPPAENQEAAPARTDGVQIGRRELPPAMTREQVLRFEMGMNAPAESKPSEAPIRHAPPQPTAGLGVIAQLDEVGPVQKIDGPSRADAFRDLALVGPASIDRFRDASEFYLNI